MDALRIGEAVTTQVQGKNPSELRTGIVLDIGGGEAAVRFTDGAIKHFRLYKSLRWGSRGRYSGPGSTEWILNKRN